MAPLQAAPSTRAGRFDVAKTPWAPQARRWGFSRAAFHSLCPLIIVPPLPPSCRVRALEGGHLLSYALMCSHAALSGLASVSRLYTQELLPARLAQHDDEPLDVEAAPQQRGLGYNLRSRII